MPKRSSRNRPRDVNVLAASTPEEATAEGDEVRKKDPAAVELGRLGGKEGGAARAKKLSKEAAAGDRAEGSTNPVVTGLASSSLPQSEHHRRVLSTRYTAASVDSQSGNAALYAPHSSEGWPRACLCRTRVDGA